jgi:hypothetical protein
MRANLLVGAEEVALVGGEEAVGIVGGAGGPSTSEREGCEARENGIAKKA